MTDLFNHTRAFFHFIGRLLKRVSRWGNRPLSEEQIRWGIRIGEIKGEKKAEKKMEHTALWYDPRVRSYPPQQTKPPEQHTGPEVLHPSPGSLLNAYNIQKQKTGVLPRISGVLQAFKHPAFHAAPLVPPLTQDMPLKPTPKRTVPPIDHITTQRNLVPESLAPEVRKLFHDTSWLNDKEGETPHDPFPVQVVEPDDDATEHRLPVVGKRLTTRFYPRV